MEMLSEESKDTFGRLSFAAGLFAFLLFGTMVTYLLIVASIVFGIIQLAQSNKKVFAILGIVISVVSLIMGICYWAIIIAKSFGF